MIIIDLDEDWFIKVYLVYDCFKDWEFGYINWVEEEGRDEMKKLSFREKNNNYNSSR